VDVATRALSSLRERLSLRTYAYRRGNVFSTQHEKKREMKEEQSDSLLLLRIIKSSRLYIYAALKYECDDCLRAFVKPKSSRDVAKVLKISSLYLIRKPSSTVAMRTTVSQTLIRVSRSDVFPSSFSSSFSDTMRMHALASASSSRGEKTFRASAKIVPRHVVKQQRKEHHHHHRLKMKNNSCNRTFSSNSARDDYQHKMSAVRSFASSSAAASGENHRHHVSLINGSNRGIGLAFAKHLLETNNESIVGDKRTNGTVIATCRNPDEAKDLHELREKFGTERLEILRIDVLDEKTIEAAAKLVSEKYGRLDCVINTAAVLHLPDRKMVPETSILRFDPEACVLSYRTNAIGPMLMTKHFSKLMLKTAEENDEGKPVPVIASLSARVSSISDNKLGGWYSYRGGKTALNQMTQTAHVEFSRKKNPIAMVLLHPGTVDTELSTPFKKNVPEGKLFTPEYSAGRMLEVLKDVTLKDSGKFYDYAGEEVAW
jgi:NAD(P)-dependent dehydrogenase (short-subunit alcohol dehydrogenase family)